jgi:hypothetical protein
MMAHAMMKQCSVRASSKEKAKTMTPTTGIVRNGKIEIIAPVDCHEGEQVTVWVDSNAIDNQFDDDESLQSIAERVKAIEEFEPLQLTAAEQDLFEQAIGNQRKFELGNLEARVKKIEGLLN